MNPFSWFIGVFIYLFLQRAFEPLTGKLSVLEFVNTLTNDYSQFLIGPYGQMVFFVGAVVFLFRAAALLVTSEARQKQAIIENQNRIESQLKASVAQAEVALNSAHDRIHSSISNAVKPMNRIEGLKVLRGSLDELKETLGIMQSGISQLISFREVILGPSYSDHEVQINHKFSEIFREFNRGLMEAKALLKADAPHPNLGIGVTGRVDDMGGHSFSLSDNPNLSSQIDTALQDMRTSLAAVQHRESQVRSNIISIASDLAQDLKVLT